MDALAGKAITVYGVNGGDAQKASARIDGDVWAVQADKPLKDGDSVKILKIDGTTLITLKEEK
jgi:membrane protein implicated in regulation of membrane protease activity